jgi:hypothetical protein
MDTVSNGGFLQFSAGGILSPLPGDLARDYGPCDYDIPNNLNAQYVYQLPVKVRNGVLGDALNGWGIEPTSEVWDEIYGAAFYFATSGFGGGLIAPVSSALYVFTGINENYRGHRNLKKERGIR